MKPKSVTPGRGVHHPGLPLIAAAVLAGDLTVQCLPGLLPVPVLATMVLLALAVCWRWPRSMPLLLLVAGFAWASLWATQALDQRLAPELAGRDFVVTGQVHGLVRQGDREARFRFQVKQASLDGTSVPLAGKLRLAWYGPAGRTVAACQHWRLRVRLKPPRGMVNRGAFDGEKSSLEKGIVAVGYVRQAPDNQLLRDAWCIAGLRARLSRAIDDAVADPVVTPLLQALAVADKRGLDDRHWTVARANGITHLLAISGFHVGIAALFGSALAGLLWRFVPGRRRWPRQPWQAGAAFAVALAYALLAGMGLPTQRTLVMIAVFCLARVLRRHCRVVDALALALLAVLLVDPLAVLSAGMWLSFAAVAFLLLGSVHDHGWRGWLRQFGRAQTMMTVALLPLTVWFFGQASILGAPANLVAIPVVSLVVVPLTLAGCVMSGLWPGLAALLWQVAGFVMHLLWHGMVLFADAPLALLHLPQAGWWAMALALLGAVWLLWPRGLPARWLGLMLFLPLLFPLQPRVPPGAFRASVIDVGQGLAVLVRTADHALLYDAGPRYPSGFDVGEAVVVPVLRASGVRRLDMLVVSHGDNDHAGGAPAVHRVWPQAPILASDSVAAGLRTQLCRKGQHWSWDGVEFRVLHPVEPWPGRSNDGSCVLLVTGQGGRLLLPGDISSLVEPVVARQIGRGPPMVVIVPHHGSASSSRRRFVQATQPRIAVISAGWHNRYGHPAVAVTRRYRAASAELVNTAVVGETVLAFPATAPPRVVFRARCDQRRYWRPCGADEGH